MIKNYPGFLKIFLQKVAKKIISFFLHYCANYFIVREALRPDVDNTGIRSCLCFWASFSYSLLSVQKEENISVDDTSLLQLRTPVPVASWYRSYKHLLDLIVILVEPSPKNIAQNSQGMNTLFDLATLLDLYNILKFFEKFLCRAFNCRHARPACKFSCSVELFFVSCMQLS